ncbi:unnamed protein product [Closterium sp. Yama58-4]|nr:unnamed protein product [Closterium sp. Yama58-4]
MSRVVTDGDLSPQRHFPRNRGPAYVAAPRGIQYPEDLISPTNAGVAPSRAGDHVRRPAGRTPIRTVQEGHQLTEGDDFADNRGGGQRRITIPSGGGGGGYHGNTSPLRNAIHGRSESHSGESGERGGRAEHAGDLQPRRAASSNEAGYGRPAALRLDADMIKAGRKDSLSPRRMVKVATPSAQPSSAAARAGGPGGGPGGGGIGGSFQASRGEAEHMRRVAELMEAVRENDVDLVNVVLQEAPSRTALLNTVYPASQRTALHEAVVASSTEAAGALLEWGADPDGGQSAQMPPIMYAVQTGNDKMVTLLLSHGADINAQDAKQYTALHYACAAGHRGIIKLLLVAGANMYARNRDGLYPQQLASTDRIRTLFRKLHDSLSDAEAGSFGTRRHTAGAAITSDRSRLAAQPRPRNFADFRAERLVGQAAAGGGGGAGGAGGAGGGGPGGGGPGTPGRGGMRGRSPYDSVDSASMGRLDLGGGGGSRRGSLDGKSSGGGARGVVDVFGNPYGGRGGRAGDVAGAGGRASSDDEREEGGGEGEKKEKEGESGGEERKGGGGKEEEKKAGGQVPVSPSNRRAAAGAATGSASANANAEKASPAAAAAGGKELMDGEAMAPLGTMKWKRGELLGEGAYGKVFLGLNEMTGELMAVKQIKMTSAGDEKAMHIAALEQEIVLYRQMRHRHIVAYIDMEKDESDGSLYIFLEFISGGSIHSMLDKFGKFSESLVRVYTRQLLLGLEYLHGCKIIHRDIKGGNVLVDRDGVIKLADFGASKAFHEGTVGEGCKSIRGSVFWMAPEVIKGEGYGRRADIWSLGCTVIEMLTGSHPWPNMDNTWSAIFHIAKTTTGPPIPEECSDEGKDFLAACFKLDPGERPSATECSDEGKDFLAACFKLDPGERPSATECSDEGKDFLAACFKLDPGERPSATECSDEGKDFLAACFKLDPGERPSATEEVQRRGQGLPRCLLQA